MLERMIKLFSSPCDFFVGSGTTAVVAEKLGRKWIATNLAKLAICTSMQMRM